MTRSVLLGVSPAKPSAFVGIGHLVACAWQWLVRCYRDALLEKRGKLFGMLAKVCQHFRQLGISLDRVQLAEPSPVGIQPGRDLPRTVLFSEIIVHKNTNRTSNGAGVNINTSDEFRNGTPVLSDTRDLTPKFPETVSRYEVAITDGI